MDTTTTNNIAHAETGNSSTDVYLESTLTKNTASPIVPSGSSDLNKGDVDYTQKAKNKTKFSDYARIFTYSTLSDRIFLGFAILGEIGTGATLPLMNIIFGNLVGGFADYFVPGSTTTKAEFDAILRKQTLYIIYIFIARWTLSYYSLLAFRMVGLRISGKLRLAYLKALFSLPISVLDTLPSGQASNTITTTSNVLQIGISDKLGIFVQFESMMITSIIIAFIYSWALTLVTSSLLVAVGIVYGTIIPIIIKKNKEVEFADEKASSIAGEVLGSIRMIVACGAESKIAQRYSGWVQESKKRGLKISLLTGAQYAPLFFAVYSTMALCFWYGFKLYRQNHIDSVGTIVIVLMSVMMVAMSLGQTAAPIVAASKAASASTDFFAIIDAPKPDIKGLKAPEVSAQHDIRFESVDFAYPGRPHVKVLDDFCATFEAGKITAIVGASGSGKSTVIGLLERWYELRDNEIVIPESAMQSDESKKDKKSEEPEVVAVEEPKIELRGSISAGEHTIDSLDMRWWRSQIGLVQQEPFIFNDTIMNNVKYGLIGSIWENEDDATKNALVVEACSEAFATEFIDRLPQGYDTQVGDAGIKLSGGQRQRLAIARSIIKRPKILILDEATSSIDVRGEGLVQAALDKVSEGRTTITIAHRLSTIKKADKIIVLKKGKVMEEGTHNSLLEKPDGVYFALVHAQQLSMDETVFEANDTKETILRSVDHKESKNDVIEITSDAAYKPKGFLNSFGLLMYEQRKIWPWYTILLLGCLGSSTATPLQSYLFAQLVVVITKVGQDLIDSVNHLSLMFFILALGIGTAYFLMGWSSQAISMNISSHYRQEYFESILAKPIKFFDSDENSSGTLTARVANDPTQLQQLLGINLAMALNAVLSVIGCVIIAFVFGWKLALVATFVAMPLIMGGAYFRVQYEIQFEAMNMAVFAESSKFAAESIGAFRTVTALTLEDMICKRYQDLLADHVSKAFKKARWSTMVFAFSDSVALLCQALTFWYGGQLLARREYGPVQFFVVYMAALTGAESAGSFLSLSPNIAQASAAANRILSFRTREIQDPKTPPEVPDMEGGVKIDLQDIWFKYPTRDIPIFTGLNLTVQKGQFAALVGPSGCGKTSIISLLERFYDPQNGSILINNTPISTLPHSQYRSLISLVAQEPTLLQGTIRSNVLLGVSPTTPDPVLHEACRAASIHDFIISLPAGYDTPVGNAGVSLSGGQKQRLAIARALIRDPRILLLDEATSSLDSESEKLVQAAFERAAKGRTMVVVAHRLATVQNADVIFVLGEGRVLEVGNHRELLGRRGVYYQMCQSQALDR